MIIEFEVSFNLISFLSNRFYIKLTKRTTRLTLADVAFKLGIGTFTVSPVSVY